jgi:hypothetical protein
MNFSFDISKTKAVLIGIGDYYHMSKIEPAYGNLEDFSDLLTDVNLIGLPKNNIYLI